ncbi:maleate cis-trans isomerase [Lipingzhangella sp. LS1_29]|uniref:Maleate cis-trans isomerase n=1 Tax=Lipingzhangella rawalii TaxID=2055835 RepID=A0ABU2HA87_9ACTN|nr:maleate cis-trans isomerase [Lipingzhangella rawalii]MDS1271779.1 maleate cis-trans isomerase [Lipingzhangella rawalii]
MSHTPVSVGFLYPGYSAEDDYPEYQRLLGDAVTLRLVHTLMREDAHRVDALLDVGGTDVLTPGARELRAQGVDAVVWACTSGSFVFGWDGAAQQAQAVGEAAGVPASSTSFAFVHAAHALGLRRVAIAATYPRDVAERFVAFLTHGGTEVVALASRGIATAAEVGTLDSGAAVDFVVANDHPDADGVLVPDTALHSAGILASVERELGKPVLCANQVSVWEGLRLAGATPRDGRAGLGTLFETGRAAA